MRKVIMLAAMLIASGMTPVPADAGERGPGFHRGSPHGGAKRHFSHHGKKFLHHGKRFRGGDFGQRRHFAHRGPRFHGGHFGHQRHFRPRGFGHSRGGHFRGGNLGSGFVLKFHDGGLGFRLGHAQSFKPHHFRRHHPGPVLRFGDVPHFKPHFGPRHHHLGPVLRFGHSHVKPWRFSGHHRMIWRGRSHDHW